MKYYLGRNDPTSGTLKMRSAYYFNGDCNDEEVQADLKEAYIPVLQERYPYFCNAETTCRVENIQIHCGVVDVSRKRRRRRNIEMEVNSFQYFVCIYIEKKLALHWYICVQ